MPKKRNPEVVKIGERLKKLRLSQGYDTIRAFANFLNVNEDTYRAWELGDNLIPPAWVAVLQNRFKVDYNYIYGDDNAGLPKRLIEQLQKRA